MDIIILISLLLVTFGIASASYYRKMKQIAIRRENPDICTYARSFDYRAVDTKIIHEVFEQIQEWVGKYNGIPFPVQAEDHFNDLYCIDLGDLDEIYIKIAKKLNISTENAKNNPY
jgi:hypothetical protein